MAKDAYLRDGLILFSDAGAFRTEQRIETAERLVKRLDRISNELCALPHHPRLGALEEPTQLAFFSGEVDEMCDEIRKMRLLLRGRSIFEF